MGDRCYLEVFVLKQDVAKFCESAPFEPDEGTACDDQRQAVRFEDDQANYGHWTDLEAAAEAGCTFEGWHSEGGEYDGCHFAAIDGKLHSVVATTHEGAVVRISPETGRVLKEDADAARRYFAAQRAVLRAMTT